MKDYFIDNNILFIILEYIDEYQVNTIYKIQPDKITINDIINISNNNNKIKDELIKQEWINKYTFEVIKELSFY